MTRNPFRFGLTEKDINWKISVHRSKDRLNRSRTIHICACGHWHGSGKQARDCNTKARQLLRAAIAKEQVTTRKENTMSNARCDHYWLSRRGGKCPFCGDVFPGNARPSKYELVRRIGREPSQSELVAEANKPNPTEPRELIHIGDVIVCDGHPRQGNPYQQGLMGDERKSALLRYMRGGNTNGFTLWYAPASGGARGIGPCEVDWASSGILREEPKALEVCTGPGPVHTKGSRHLCGDCRPEEKTRKRTYEDAMNH